MEALDIVSTSEIFSAQSFREVSSIPDAVFSLGILVKSDGDNVIVTSPAVALSFRSWVGHGLETTLSIVGTHVKYR